MNNFNVITMPGGEQHVTYIGPEVMPARPSVRVRGIVTAEKLVAAGLALEYYARRNKDMADLILPYFPGARQDRAQGNVALSVDVYAGLVSSMHFRTLVIADPHSEAVVRYLAVHKVFGETIEVIDHQTWFLRWLDSTTFAPGLHKFLFPDKGAAEKYSKVNAYLPYKSCEKTRDAATGKITGMSVPSLRGWEENYVWIVDDICDGGRTFIEIAKKVREEMGHHVSLNLAVTHGIFSNGIHPLLYDNQKPHGRLFDTIVTTDSVYDNRYNANQSHGGDNSFRPLVSIQPLDPIIKEMGIHV